MNLTTGQDRLVDQADDGVHPPDPHPRLRHFPHHADYQKMSVDRRPFVMYMQEARYRSRSVNTDGLGLREQRDASGRFLDVPGLADMYPGCNVIVGGSTVFGVDATSDDRTMSAYLQQDDLPCINLGNRGATFRQELILFLLMKSFLPPVHNVIIFSGVNEVSLCSLDAPLEHRLFGPTFAQYVRDAWTAPVRRSLVRRAASKAARLRRAGPSDQGSLVAPRVSESVVQRRLESLQVAFKSDLDVWVAVAGAMGASVVYVLQPCLGWGKRDWTSVERECYEADLATVPSIERYANPAMWGFVRALREEAARAAGLPFFDANEWFAVDDHQTIFTDVCHMTDHGYAVFAESLRQHVPWRGPS